MTYFVFVVNLLLFSWTGFWEADPSYWNEQAKKTLDHALKLKPQIHRAKNIILFLGDGELKCYCWRGRVRARESVRLRSEGLSSNEIYLNEFRTWKLQPDFCWLTDKGLHWYGWEVCAAGRFLLGMGLLPNMNFLPIMLCPTRSFCPLWDFPAWSFSWTLSFCPKSGFCITWGFSPKWGFPSHGLLSIQVLLPNKRLLPNVVRSNQRKAGWLLSKQSHLPNVGICLATVICPARGS